MRARRSWPALLGAALMLVLGGACASRGGGEVAALQSEEEIDALLARVEPYRRDIPGAVRPRLYEAAEGWLERGFGTVEYRDPERFQLEAPTALIDVPDAPIPAARKVSIELKTHPFDRDSVRMEVVALALEPAYDSERLAASAPGAPADWRLAGQDEEFEAWVADRILERYRLLEQGLDPDALEDARGDRRDG